MTTLAEARASIYSRLMSTPPIPNFTFEGEDYTPPANGSWMRLSVRHLSGSQRTLGRPGTRRFRRQGLITGQIFTALGKGMKTGDDIGQTVLDLYEGQSFDGVDCFNGFVRESAPDDDYLLHIASINFDYDEVK